MRRFHRTSVPKNDDRFRLLDSVRILLFDQATRHAGVEKAPGIDLVAPKVLTDLGGHDAREVIAVKTDEHLHLGWRHSLRGQHESAPAASSSSSSSLRDRPKENDAVSAHRKFSKAKREIRARPLKERALPLRLSRYSASLLYDPE